MLSKKKSLSVTEVKFVFDILIKQIILKKPGQALEKDSTVSVLVERGSKHLTTGEKEIKLNTTGDAVISVGESLTLDATMYQENQGAYQEKIGKLTVRKRKRGLMSSHAPIGQMSLALHNLLEEAAQPVEKTCLLEQSSFPGSQIVLSITFRRLDGKAILPAIHFSLPPSDSTKSLASAASSSNSAAVDPFVAPPSKAVAGGAKSNHNAPATQPVDEDFTTSTSDSFGQV